MLHRFDVGLYVEWSCSLTLQIGSKDQSVSYHKEHIKLQNELP